MTKEIELTLGEWQEFRAAYRVIKCTGIPDPFNSPIYWCPMGPHEAGSLTGSTIVTPYLFTLVSNCAVFTVKEAATV